MGDPSSSVPREPQQMGFCRVPRGWERCGGGMSQPDAGGDYATPWVLCDSRGIHHVLLGAGIGAAAW